MKLYFEPEEHKYTSDDNPDEKWISVTSLVDKYVPEFDEKKMAISCSKKKSSKWYGINPKEILEAWHEENKRSTDLGTWFHEQREKEALDAKFQTVDGFDIPVFKSLDENGKKISSEQKLVDGIYPEHLVYLKTYHICGQSDRVEVVNGYVNIIDYKTNKSIDRHSFIKWDGTSNKMLPPLNHMEDCNLAHYALQLSLYMYIILKHNPNLKPGTLKIVHAIFESDGENKYGYPIYKKDENGNYIVKETVEYECQYLKNEVKSILEKI